MKFMATIFITLFTAHFVLSQNDSLPFESFRERIVLHTSFSFRDAPFNISGEFGEFDNLKYRSNTNLIHGFGIAYKWFALNVNYKIPNSAKSSKKHGKTNYFDLGMQFTLKKVFVRVDFHDYIGYGIRNASIISDTIPVTSKGIFVNEKLQAASFGINVYYLPKTELNMKAAIGIVGRYVKPTHGFYMRFGMNVFGISSPTPIVPTEYFEPKKSILSATNLSALDLGVIPGYAYLNNINGWQFGAFLGVGGALQAKFNIVNGETEGSLGLSPLFELRAQGGYNVENWFLMLNSFVDYRKIDFMNIKFNQTYYNIQLTYGYRFEQKKKKNN